MVTYVQKRLNASKISHKWEEPYVIKVVYDIGYFRIHDPDSEEFFPSINAEWLSYIILEIRK